MKKNNVWIAEFKVETKDWRPVGELHHIRRTARQYVSGMINFNTHLRGFYRVRKYVSV